MAFLVIVALLVALGLAGWLFGADSRPAASDPPQQEWPFLPRRR